MWSIRLNLPITCSAAADEDGEAPDRRGEAYGFDGVAILMVALAYQPSPVLSRVYVQCSATSEDADIELASERCT